MATVNIAPLSVKIPNVQSDKVTVTASTVAANDVVKIDAAPKHLTLVYVCGATAGDLTINAGNGTQATNDLTVTGTANAAVAIELDTAAFEQVAGDDKGKILAKAGAAGALYVTGA